LYYCSLVSWWRNLESKWHDYPNKSYLINDEYIFVHVFKGDHDLMITEKSIQKQIDLMTHHFVKHLFSKRQRIWIFFSSSIESSKIHTILIFLLFFSITTIDNSQLVSSTRAMKLALKSLSKSYLIIAT
jgi:hypothetical protein